MGTLFTRGTENVVVEALDESAVDLERVEPRPVPGPVDSNAVRWVFAATVAFWLVVYAAGRSFF